MVTFWERTTRSVDPMFSLCIMSFVILDISRFGFRARIWVLITPVPGHCILVALLAF